MRHVEPEPGGRFLNERDEAERRRVCVIGSQVRTGPLRRRARDRSEPRDLGDPLHRHRHPAREEAGQQLQRSGRRQGLHPRRRRRRVASAIATRTTSSSSSPSGSRARTSSRGSRGARPRATTSIRPTRKRSSIWDVGEMLVMLPTIFLGFRVFLGLIGVAHPRGGRHRRRQHHEHGGRGPHARTSGSRWRSARAHAGCWGRSCWRRSASPPRAACSGVASPAPIVCGCQFLPLREQHRRRRSSPARSPR